MIMTIGILGYGEIGKSIARFYQSKKRFNLLVKDRKIDEFSEQKLDILNIAIPYFGERQFIDVVASVIKKNKPKLVIIHSTVVPGTTKKLIRKTKAKIVHSPVRGVHPKLYEGIKTFIKFIGAGNTKTGQLAKKHFQSIGIKNVKILIPAAATELNKLIDTTYYAHCIVFTEYVDEIFRKYKIPFEAFQEFNLSYNEGYKKLGKTNVVRPTLLPTRKFDVPGKITGHCQIPNAQILEKLYPHSLTKQILKYR
jgi:hypothetical protein